MEIIGTKFNWEGFDRAKVERWEKLGPHQFHCKLHDVYFDSDGYDENNFEDAEPC